MLGERSNGGPGLDGMVAEHQAPPKMSTPPIPEIYEWGRLYSGGGLRLLIS